MTPIAKTYQLSKEDSDVIAVENCPTEYWKELIHVGTFYHPVEGFEFTVDDTLIKHWDYSGRMMLSCGIDVPLPIEHTKDPEKRRGKITEYQVKPNREGLTALYGRVKFNDPKQAKQLSQSGVSIFVPEQIYDKSGRVFPNAIEHVAITDYPVINGLEGFQAIALSKTKPPTKARPMPPVAPAADTKSYTLQDIAQLMGIPDTVTDTQELINAIYTAAQGTAKPAAETPAEGEAPETPAEGEAPAAPASAAAIPPTGTVPPVAAPVAGGQGGKVVAHIVKASKTIALSKNIIDQLRDAREMQILRLSEGENRKITPAVAKRLRERFCTDAAIQLSSTDEGDGFKELLADFAANEPISVGSKTPPQGKTLELSRNPDEEIDNPLLRDAEKRCQDQN